MNSASANDVVAVVLPPTDRPAVDDPLLELVRAEQKRKARNTVAWLVAHAAGVALLHGVLKSPFTGATLVAYGLFVVTFPVEVINWMRAWRIESRQRKWFGDRSWRWIEPGWLTVRDERVVFTLDLADGGTGEVHLGGTISRRTELVRHYGLWVVHDGGPKARVRIPGSLAVRHEMVAPTEQAKALPPAAKTDLGSTTPRRPWLPWFTIGHLAVFASVVVLVQLGLLWIALGSPQEAFEEQPATVIVVLATCVIQLVAVLETWAHQVRIRRVWNADHWRPAQLDVIDVRYSRPWRVLPTVRGTARLADGTAIPVRIRDASSDLVANIEATGTLWVIDPPRPGTRTLAGVPGLALHARVTFDSAT